MTFRYTTANIGPYCVSLARGQSGQIQKFRFPVPVQKGNDIAQALLIVEGKIQVGWSTGAEFDTELGVGGSFALDQGRRPLAVNEEMTLSAATKCAFLCVSAVGSAQKVHMERIRLSPGERTSISRYDLVAVAGPDSAIRVNNEHDFHGIRLVYPKTQELDVVATAPSLLGVFSFCN